MALLTTAEIAYRLNSVPNWKLEGAEIIRVFRFPDFVTGLHFVNLVAERAEALQHHPDIDIRYNKVRLALTSHDAGGLTERDFELAEICDVVSTTISK